MPFVGHKCPQLSYISGRSVSLYAELSKYTVADACALIKAKTIHEYLYNNKPIRVNYKKIFKQYDTHRKGY